MVIPAYARYDAAGRAVLSEHAGGVDRVTFAYNADGATTVTDALGQARTYTYTSLFGVKKLAEISGGPCLHCGPQARSTTYDANGFVASRTDFNGHLTTYVHDARGLELARTEGAGTPEERTLTTEWHSEFRLPTRMAEPGRVSEFSYDSAGRLLSKTEMDPASGASRTWTYTYTAQGLLASVDGPRTEVPDRTTYTYEAQGNLATVTNALGHVTRITQYDAHGRPLRIEDPNGAITELRYDARGRLLSQSINGSMTRFDYDPAGNLNKLTLPTGGFYSYRYDAAHRLTGITDKPGNRRVYTLDALGNRVREDSHDPAGAPTYTQERVYDNLNRLLQDLGGMGQTTEYDYDAQGNLTARIDPLNHPTQVG